jgi:c(7)-type cytochrome triheme protein
MGLAATEGELVVMKSLLLFVTLVLTSVGTAVALDLKAPPMTPLARDGIHDPTVETIHILQDPKQSMKDFPKDRRGEVNWVEALNQGVINPRTTNTGRPEDGAPMKTLDLDILMTDTAQMPNVRFPHLAHTRWLACSNCHPDIFVPKKNGNPVTMEKVLRGQFCGRCHDKVSFALWTCERCHSVPHKNSPPAWW